MLGSAPTNRNDRTMKPPTASSIDPVCLGLISPIHPNTLRHLVRRWRSAYDSKLNAPTRKEPTTVAWRVNRISIRSA